MLKAMRAKDYTFTVLGSQPVTEHYLRLQVDTGGLLAVEQVHPTIWVRLWFDHPDKPRAIHQRGYTLVDADPENGSCWLEFAVHDGIAVRWAQAAQTGTTIEATVQGSALTLPAREEVDGYVVVGDPASLPGMNSLLDAVDTVTWVRREGPKGTSALLDTVAAAAAEIGVPGERLFGWAACDTKTTRALARTFRGTYGIPKEQTKTTAYWM